MSYAALARDAKSPNGPKIRVASSNLGVDRHSDSRKQEMRRDSEQALAERQEAGPQWSISRMAIEHPGRTAPEAVRRVLGSSRGENLPLSIAADFSRKFDFDLSHAKVHRDGEASEAVRSIGANAFAHGRDIFFRDGAFQPHTLDGQALLAHELAHVVQQTRNARASSSRSIQPVSSEEYAQRASQHQVEGRFALDAGPAAPLSVAADSGLSYEDDDAKMSVLSTADETAERVVDLEDEANRQRAAAGGTDASIGREDEKAQNLRDAVQTSIAPSGRRKHKKPAPSPGPNSSPDLREALPAEVEDHRRALAKAQVLNPDPKERARIRGAIEKTESAQEAAGDRVRAKALRQRVNDLRYQMNDLQERVYERHQRWLSTSSWVSGNANVYGGVGDEITSSDLSLPNWQVKMALDAVNAGRLDEADALWSQAFSEHWDLNNRFAEYENAIQSIGRPVVKTAQILNLAGQKAAKYLGGPTVEKLYGALSFALESRGQDVDPLAKLDMLQGALSPDVGPDVPGGGKPTGTAPAEEESAEPNLSASEPEDVPATQGEAERPIENVGAEETAATDEAPAANNASTLDDESVSKAANAPDDPSVSKATKAPDDEATRRASAKLAGDPDEAEAENAQVTQEPDQDANVTKPAQTSDAQQGTAGNRKFYYGGGDGIRKGMRKSTSNPKVEYARPGGTQPSTPKFSSDDLVKIGQAEEAAADLGRPLQVKTKAQTFGGATQRSGYGDAVGGDGDSRAVLKKGQEIGHDFAKNSSLDGGVPGREKASHAEKVAAIKNPNEPLAVDKAVCSDCFIYFQKQAIADGKTPVIREPNVTWVFFPDGTVVGKGKGAVSVVHPDGTASGYPISQSPTETSPP